MTDEGGEMRAGTGSWRERISAYFSLDCCSEEMEHARFRLLWMRCRKGRIWSHVVLAVIAAARLSFPAQVAHLARQADRGAALPAAHAAVLCAVVTVAVVAAVRASRALPATRKERMRWNLLTLGQWVGFGCHQALVAVACGHYRSLPSTVDYGLCADVLSGNFAVVFILCPLVFTVVATEYLCLPTPVTAAAGTIHLTVNAAMNLAVAGSSLRGSSLWSFALGALAIVAIIFVSANHVSLLRDVMDAGRKESEANSAANELRNRAEVAEAARATHEQTMAYIMHEIRNPTHAASGAAWMLEDGWPFNSHHPLSRELKQLRTSLSQIATMVDDALEERRTRARPLDIKPAPSSVRIMLRDLCRQMGRMAPVPLHLRVAVSVPPLALFDPSRVRRVLANGLSNAAKLSADAPILILAHAEQTSTNSSLLEESRSGGTLQLQIVDAGPGLCGASHHALFQDYSGSYKRPYEEAERRRAQMGMEAKGPSDDHSHPHYSRSKDPRFALLFSTSTGLGLSCARKVVEAMEGTLTLYDRAKLPRDHPLRARGKDEDGAEAAPSSAPDGDSEAPSHDEEPHECPKPDLTGLEDDPPCRVVLNASSGAVYTLTLPVAYVDDQDSSSVGSSSMNSVSLSQSQSQSHSPGALPQGADRDPSATSSGPGSGLKRVASDQVSVTSWQSLDEEEEDEEEEDEEAGRVDREDATQSQSPYSAVAGAAGEDSSEEDGAEPGGSSLLHNRHSKSGEAADWRHTHRHASQRSRRWRHRAGGRRGSGDAALSIRTRSLSEQERSEEGGSVPPVDSRAGGSCERGAALRPISSSPTTARAGSGEGGGSLMPPLSTAAPSWRGRTDAAAPSIQPQRGAGRGGGAVAALTRVAEAAPSPTVGPASPAGVTATAPWRGDDEWGEGGGAVTVESSTMPSDSASSASARGRSRQQLQHDDSYEESLSDAEDGSATGSQRHARGAIDTSEGPWETAAAVVVPHASTPSQHEQQQQQWAEAGAVTGGGHGGTEPSPSASDGRGVAVAAEDVAPRLVVPQGAADSPRSTEWDTSESRLARTRGHHTSEWRQGPEAEWEVPGRRRWRRGSSEEQREQPGSNHQALASADAQRPLAVRARGVAPSESSSAPVRMETTPSGAAGQGGGGAVPASPHWASSHVLVVDDESINRRLLSRMLQRLGVAHVRTASDGDQALRTIKRRARTDSPVHLVFCDIMMQRMDGDELLRRCRQELGSECPTFVPCTGTASAEDLSRLRSLGFVGILKKPFLPPQVERCLSSLVE